MPTPEDPAGLRELQEWFAKHVTLEGKPYTLDADQVRAVADLHKNTLVTARAGSGKTRVIVAKIVYLLARKGYKPAELAGFMFNRTAAAEVNQRIAAVCIDGRPIIESECRIALTFHKFALDLTKMAGQKVQIISETEQNHLIERKLSEYYQAHDLKVSRQVYIETLKLVNSFVTRAGQKYPGERGLEDLRREIGNYCHSWSMQRAKLQTVDPEAQKLKMLINLHQVALTVYEEYFKSLQDLKIDFNTLMARATKILYDLARGSGNDKLAEKIHPIRYILVDEYQDFSYLFFNLIQGIRAVCPAAHLFAVGDDWQAINRFAGSDCDYFLRFSEYFSEDTLGIPLATNYRSDHKIVENANQFMLKFYDSKALPAKAFNHTSGRIRYLNPNKVRFDRSDLQEDGLGDGRFLQSLATQNDLRPTKVPSETGKLLKLLVKLVKKHRHEQIMILHRHNFTSFSGVTLEGLERALMQISIEEGIHSKESFTEQVRFLTMHRSKGLEADVVILLEMNQDLILGSHPHANIFQIFGDTPTNERADQQRLIYVALTRAKHRLYLLSADKKPPV